MKLYRLGLTSVYLRLPVIGFTGLLTSAGSSATATSTKEAQ
jgi:hypothetical protein